MTNAGLAASVAVAVLLALALPSVAVQDESGLAIVEVDVVAIPGRSETLPDQTVLVRDGVISAIGYVQDVPIPEGFAVIEAAGQVLIPGLVDMHVHLEHFERPAVLELLLANGVTTVRNMDGRPYILEWRDAVAEGEMTGPRIVTAGPILDGDPPLRDDNTAVGSVEAAIAAVREQAEAGYDFIKVYANLQPEVHAAIIDAAHARGLPVAGHVPTSMSATDVLASGQEFIEHLSGYDELIEADDSPYRDRWHWSKLYLAMPADPARIARAATATAAAGTWSVPTLVQQDKIAPIEEMRRWLDDPVMRYVPERARHLWAPENRDPYSLRLLEALDEEDLETLRRGEANRARLVRALHEAGAGLLVGTDTPNPFVVPGFAVHEELQELVEAGLTPAEALAAATVAPARALGLDETIGTVEVGKAADLVLLRANPVEEIGNSTRIAGVMAGGNWYPESRLRAMLEHVAATYR